MRVIKKGIYCIHPGYIFKCNDDVFVSSTVILHPCPDKYSVKVYFDGKKFFIYKYVEPQSAYKYSGYPAIFGEVGEERHWAVRWDDFMETVVEKIIYARKRRRVHSVSESTHRSSGYV